MAEHDNNSGWNGRHLVGLGMGEKPETKIDGTAQALDFVKRDKTPNKYLPIEPQPQAEETPKDDVSAEQRRLQWSPPT